MKVEAINPETQERMEVEITDEQLSQMDELMKERVSDSKLDRYIENLELSADVKALIHDIKKATVRAGQQIIKVGKRAIEIVLAILRQFPNVGFGVVLGLLLGALTAAIPVIGWVLGAFCTPLFAAFGFVQGLREDIKDKALDRKIREAVAMYQPLNGEA